MDHEKIVRDTCRSIGFVSNDVSLDADNCKGMKHQSLRLSVMSSQPNLVPGSWKCARMRPILGLRPDGKTQNSLLSIAMIVVPWSQCVSILFSYISTQYDETIHDKDILKLVNENFDFRPRTITINLELTGENGRFLKIAAFGHFGRDDPDFTWEVVETLKWK
ncbi:hypothetical protein VNO80_15453 [Phaseolus coccineus]|uniref:S-adenosylmethionine synthetase C-terminal domain-containing protein n=1 Tax=Phaseolus coccineus TaxID=3886 RepID=A0AAN9MLN6_PHACN